MALCWKTQEWVVGTTLALKQNFLSWTLSHPLRDANLSSGDRKSGDVLFFTTPHPWLSTRNPSSPNKLTQPKWEWLRTLYEVLHEFHTIKIHNHRFNDKNVEKAFARDYTKYVQKCPRQPTIEWWETKISKILRGKWAKSQTIKHRKVQKMI